MSIIKAVIEAINQTANFSPISDEICGEIVRSISIKLQEEYPLITLEIPADLLPLFSGESPSQFLSVLRDYPDSRDAGFKSFMPICKSVTEGSFIEAMDDFLSFTSYADEYGISLMFNSSRINFEVWVRGKHGCRQVIYYETCPSVELFRKWLKKNPLKDGSFSETPVRIGRKEYADDPRRDLDTLELYKIFKFILG